MKRQGSAFELVCPAGTPGALRVAVDEGADVVYCGFRDETNARNFPGLNFSRPEMEEGIAYAHGRGVEVYLALNTFAQADKQEVWFEAIDDAARLGADALILADIGLLAYATARHPRLRRHLSVQAAAATPEAVAFYRKEFGISRLVLPRVLSLQEIGTLCERIRPVEAEVFVFGGLCPMTEGRCTLSSYVTGKSPNKTGVCSPASHVLYEETADGIRSSLGGMTINVFETGSAAGYPTLCKGRFKAAGQTDYLFEDPVSLNIRDHLGTLAAAGVRALKIEGRQRGRAYVRDVVRSFRQSLEAFALEHRRTEDDGPLDHLTEGRRQTAGAYEKAWR